MHENFFLSLRYLSVEIIIWHFFFSLPLVTANWEATTTAKSLLVESKLFASLFSCVSLYKAFVWLYYCTWACTEHDQNEKFDAHFFLNIPVCGSVMLLCMLLLWTNHFWLKCFLCFAFLLLHNNSHRNEAEKRSRKLVVKCTVKNVSTIEKKRHGAVEHLNEGWSVIKNLVTNQSPGKFSDVHFFYGFSFSNLSHLFIHSPAFFSTVAFHSFSVFTR